MPRARHSRKRGAFKNVQTKLTTRLMQISLRMDDHIYYNKPVSRAAAEEFLREVDAMKLKCPRKDVRSLQVIDKITVLMKKIIDETREQVTKLSPTIQTYAGYSQSRSPVYSLPDEDRTENDTLCSDDPIINITEDSNDSMPVEQNNAIANVNFAISNMSIQDEILSQVHIHPDDDFSQSILDNYYNDDVVCNNVDTTHKTDASNKITITTDSNELRNHFSENATLCATMPTQGFVSPEKEIEISNNENIIPGKETAVLNFKMDKQKDTLEEKKTSQRKKPTGTKKATKKRKPNSGNFNVGGPNETSGKPNVESKCKGTKKGDYSMYVPESMKIYNRNVENDLSWVENLRYVREIGPDENDPTLCNLEDNWDDFSLPSQWNELDFYA